MPLVGYQFFQVVLLLPSVHKYFSSYLFFFLKHECFFSETFSEVNTGEAFIWNCIYQPQCLAYQLQ